MLKYINADLHRLVRRVPRFISVLVVIVFSVLLLSLFANSKTTGIQYNNMIGKFIPYCCIFIGIMELTAIYTDDFKAKTMQIAIGNGVKRRHIVLAKWMEFAVFCLIDFLVLYVLLLVVARIKGVPYGGEPSMDIFIILAFSLLKAIAATGMTMILMFFMQSGSLGALVYLACSFDIPYTIAQLVLDTGVIRSLDLSRFAMTAIMDAAQARLLVGTFSFQHFFGIIVWLVLMYTVCSVLFNKRELEF